MKIAKRLTNKVRADLLEYYTHALIIVGLPVVALVYADWRLALSVFITVQIVIGVLALRGGGNNANT